MRILMVCLGNICRSPMAEGILRDKLEGKGLHIKIDSAGTSSEHAGEHPDNRAIKMAKKYGVDISRLRARQFSSNDFEVFDRIYVMDSSNLSDVVSHAKDKNEVGKVKLLLDAAGNRGSKDVPDPWFGGMEGFENVFKLLNDACEIIADSIIKETTSSERK